MLYSCSLGLEFLDLARLVAGPHIGEYNVDPETLRDALRCALIVAGEHAHHPRQAAKNGRHTKRTDYAGSKKRGRQSRS